MLLGVVFLDENQRQPLEEIKIIYIFVIMQLATYIQDLLYRYECVIIPGFGAFLAQNQSAIYDAKTATFSPPGKTVSFNRQLQTNDGILANYVASIENTTYEVALQNIRNYTGTLSLQLMEEKSVCMDRIGEFVLNEENNVQFIPQMGSRFSTSSFGLATVSGFSITREEAIKETPVVPLEESTPLLFTPQKRSKIPYIKYAAVGVIALLLAGTGGLKLYGDSVENANNIAEQNAANRVEAEIQEATFVISSPLSAVSLNVPKEKGRYHIVAGAFKVYENAQTKKQKLIEKGYNAKIIDANKYGLYPVIYSSFETRAEANQTLKNIKRDENTSAWMLVKDITK